MDDGSRSSQDNQIPAESSEELQKAEKTIGKDLSDKYIELSVAGEEVSRTRQSARLSSVIEAWTESKCQHFILFFFLAVN